MVFEANLYWALFLWSPFGRSWNMILINQTINLAFDLIRKNSHDGLRSKPVLGPFLVVSFWQIMEHDSCRLVSVMDDPSKIFGKVFFHKIFQLLKRLWRNGSLPVQVSFAVLYHIS